MICRDESHKALKNAMRIHQVLKNAMRRLLKIC